MFRERAIGDGDERLQLAVGPEHGPPLLMLHGVLRGWQDFFPLFGPFAPRWQLHAMDFRGHGDSAPAASYRVVDYVSDAGRVLERLPRGAVLYGHSLGAMVALAAAARFPDRVAGLVLEDPPFHTMGRDIMATPFHSLFVGMRGALEASSGTSDLAARLAEVRITDPAGGTQVRLGDVRDAAALRFSAHCLRRIDPAVFDPILGGEWLEGYDIAALTGRVACPTLVLQADATAGGMLRDEDVRRLKTEGTDCTSVFFPGVGHLVHWQAWERTVGVVGNFLETLRS